MEWFQFWNWRQTFHFIFQSQIRLQVFNQSFLKYLNNLQVHNIIVMRFYENVEVFHWDFRFSIGNDLFLRGTRTNNSFFHLGLFQGVTKVDNVGSALWKSQNKKFHFCGFANFLGFYFLWQIFFKETKKKTEKTLIKFSIGLESSNAPKVNTKSYTSYCEDDLPWKVFNPLSSLVTCYSTTQPQCFIRI